MYIEGIGEVKLIAKNSPKLIKDGRKGSGGRNTKKYCDRSISEQWTKEGVVKARERVDLIIRKEVGITYGQMMNEVRRKYRGSVVDLVDLTLAECVGFGVWMVENRMGLRKKYPSMIVRVERNKMDDELHRKKEWGSDEANY